MDAQMEKIFKLIKKTGEKVVVIKDDNEFVISSLDEYLRLIEDHGQITQLTESQMLDKINRDIALWRQAQEEAGENIVEPDVIIDYKLSDTSAGSKQVIVETDNNPAIHYAPLDHQVQAQLDQLNEQIQEIYREPVSSSKEPADVISSADNDLPSVIEQPAFSTPKTSKKAKPGIPYDLAEFSEENKDKKVTQNVQQDNKTQSPSKSAEEEKPASNLNFNNTNKKNSFKKTNQPNTKLKNKARRINNFGYPNPEDTPLSEEQLNQQPSLDRQEHEDIPQPVEE